MHRKQFRKWYPHWLTVLSAALIVLAFPSFGSFTGWTSLIWLCLIPWFIALDRSSSYKHAFKEGFWLCFLMSLGGFYWLASVLHEYGNLPWAAGIAGLLIYSLVGQPQFLIMAPIFKALHKKNATLRTGFIFVALYTGIDAIVPKLFVDTLGHAFYASPRIRQIADIGGAQLLTFILVFVNYSFWHLYTKIKSRKEPSLWPALNASAPHLAVALLLCSTAWTYGWYRLNEVRAIMETNRNDPKAGFQAAVIQGNIGDFDKIAAERGFRGAGKKVMETLFGLSDSALSMEPKPDVLIWPETSYPSTFRTPQTAEEMRRDQSVEQFVRDRKIPLLFGGYDRDSKKDYNSFFFLSPETPSNPAAFPGDSDLQIYHKNMLLLFGEYIPGAEQIRFIKEAFPQVGNFGRGAGPEVLKIKLQNKDLGDRGIVRTGPIICYEALFPDYVIEAARNGSQLILNITNDSWFGPYGEPYLHLALITFRSIETRLPQLRSTNTGISALIMPDGEVTHRTTIGQPEVMNVRVPILEPIPTLMKKWGDWFGRMALVLSLLAIALPRLPVFKSVR